MRLQGTQGSPGVSQCLGLGFQVALGYHGAYWGLTMVLGISGQLDTEVSMRLYGSQGSPRGVTVSGSEVSGGPGVLQWP